MMPTGKYTLHELCDVVRSTEEWSGVLCVGGCSQGKYPLVRDVQRRTKYRKICVREDAPRESTRSYGMYSVVRSTEKTVCGRMLPGKIHAHPRCTALYVHSSYEVIHWLRRLHKDPCCPRI